MRKIVSVLIAVMFIASVVLASETVIVTKSSDTEVTLTSTVITETPKVSLKKLKQMKAQWEARKAQQNVQLDEQIAKYNKAIKDAEAQGVVDVVVKPVE